jgi:hypothetical protein
MTAIDFAAYSKHPRWEAYKAKHVGKYTDIRGGMSAEQRCLLAFAADVADGKVPAKTKSKAITRQFFLEKMLPPLAESIKKLIEKTCAPIRDRVAEVEKQLATVKAAATGAGDAQMAARVTELEKLFMELKHEGRLEYHGVWSPDQTYNRHASVTSGGCLWIAREPNQNCKPGASATWQLAVKKGRDGRDLRDHRDRTTDRREQATQ